MALGLGAAAEVLGSIRTGGKGGKHRCDAGENRPVRADMVFCLEEPSRDPTGGAPLPRGMGVPPMSDKTRSKTKDRGRAEGTAHFVLGVWWPALMFGIPHEHARTADRPSVAGSTG